VTGFCRGRLGLTGTKEGCAAKRALCLAGVLAFFLQCDAVAATKPNGQAPAAAQDTKRHVDHQHDFDWEIGDWKVHLRRLLHPLTGSTTWVEFDGSAHVRKVWNGRANLLELELDGPAGHIEGLILRLYNPSPDSGAFILRRATTAP